MFPIFIDHVKIISIGLKLNRLCCQLFSRLENIEAGLPPNVFMAQLVFLLMLFIYELLRTPSFQVIMGETFSQSDYGAVGTRLKAFHRVFHNVNLSNMCSKAEFHSINHSNVGYFTTSQSIRI